MVPGSFHEARVFETLRAKWSEIPVGWGRRNTPELLRLTDQELWHLWQFSLRETAESDFGCRGWYYCLYRDILRGKRVLDVGAGFGYDGITFAMAGASVTFLDIVESNLTVIERLCRYQDISGVNFYYMRDLESLEALKGEYDFIWCCGSLLNLPFDIARRECQVLLEHLVPKGRWVELAYPKSRWEREGRLSFERWGQKTDGGAPWVEWYDLDKMMARLAPARFRVILQFSFHNDDFNWFDLQHEA